MFIVPVQSHKLVESTLRHVGAVLCLPNILVRQFMMFILLSLSPICINKMHKLLTLVVIVTGINNHIAVNILMIYKWANSLTGMSLRGGRWKHVKLYTLGSNQRPWSFKAAMLPAELLCHTKEKVV